MVFFRMKTIRVRRFCQPVAIYNNKSANGRESKMPNANHLMIILGRSIVTKSSQSAGTADFCLCPRQFEPLPPWNLGE